MNATKTLSDTFYDAQIELRESKFNGKKKLILSGKRATMKI